MSPLEMLGRSMWEVMRMSKKLDEMVDGENELHETSYDKGDNHDSLERD